MGVMLDIEAATDAYNAARGTVYTESAVTRWCAKGQLTTARYTVETGEDGRPRAKWEIDRDELLAFTPPGRGRRAKTMEKIVLEQFGPVTRFDAAHIIDDSGRIGAYVAEPEARGGEGWDEAAFRAAVEADVASWESHGTGDKLWVQYDPGRNNATEVQVELQG